MNKATFVSLTAITWALLIFLLANQLRIERKLADSSARRASSIPSADMQVDRIQNQLAALERSLSNVVRQVETAEVRNVESTRRRTPYLPRRVDPTDVLTVPPIPSPPSMASGKRSWGPEQVTGPADTFQAGDQVTAWAPLEQDGGSEWLKVDYAKEVSVAEVRVRETYNPGAVVRLTAVYPDGRESLIWEGAEPPAQAPIDRSFTPGFGNVQARSIKIYLDTKKVSGWNEIDAVELVGSDGTRQWATNATASSTYAEQSGRSLRAVGFE
jgi:hypothetical protein